MQNIYTTGGRLVKPAPQIVDLNEYRRRLSLKSEETSVPESTSYQGTVRCIPATPRKEYVVVPAASPANISAWILDIGASICVCVMTLAFTVQVLAA